MSLPSVPHVSVMFRGPVTADAVLRYCITAVCAASADLAAPRVKAIKQFQSPMEGQCLIRA